MVLAEQWFDFSTRRRGPTVGVAQSWFDPGQRRLDQILKSAPELSIDDHSKIILLSDAHRGDRGASDEFSANEDLFVYTLSHYANTGFTYRDDT